MNLNLRELQEAQSIAEDIQSTCGLHQSDRGPDGGRTPGSLAVSVFGMGYVGSVAAACLSRDGHQVSGVEKSALKVSELKEGRSPIVEPGLGDVIEDGVLSGRLSMARDADEAVRASEISFVCVGTPSNENGSLDLTALRAVSAEIGAALRQKDEFHIVVIRSTVLPGTTREVVIPVLENTSGKSAGRDFGVCVHPEFLREGTALSDYDNPPTIVLSGTDTRSIATLQSIYERLRDRVTVTSIEVAETMKYASNSWHAVKVAFANEIGAFCREHEIDSHAVMDIFIKDKILNISPMYLRPAFAFGGSCLPKDLRALVYQAQRRDLSIPLLSSVMPSNDAHIERALRLIRGFGSRRVGVIGLSFKSDTDDLRESPLVRLVEQLLGSGYDIRIFDHNVELSRLAGANQSYVMSTLPHIEKLLVSELDEVLANADVVVLGNRDPFTEATLCQVRADQHVVDLARVVDVLPSDPNYSGIGW